MMFLCALLVLIGTCVADVVTTVRGLRLGLSERNPLVRWVGGSPWRLGAVKGIVIVVAVWQLWTFYVVAPRAAIGCTLLSAWLTGLLAMRNARLAHAVRERE